MSLSTEFLSSWPVLSHNKSPSGLLGWIKMSQEQEDCIIGFNTIASPIVLCGWHGRFCSEQKTSDAQKLNNYVLALHCSSLRWSGCDSQAPKGLWAQESGTVFRACAVGIQLLCQYLATMCVWGLTHSCWCVLPNPWKREKPGSDI